MSLQVNLSSQDIAKAYNDVLNANGIDWALFTYEKGTNDLKVQSTGSGGLEELEEEFSDGRIQYAFARVVDPNSQLPKFVQINWCGDGVPEVKKGLFHTHSSAVSRFLRGAHVVLQARNESDVAPSLIMQRVEAASGAKYSSHKEAPRKFEPIAPVGSSYKPVGRPDIAAMKAAPPP
ncbi:actin depolymerizing protein, partial [Schizophyllum commune H4-8]|uniref:actin depolymerizing protein n=1 Tax=Schizophyllum commune (strain H4-8 / FGSC 9210) TaxID=578458 RepID=UPI002160748E